MPPFEVLYFTQDARNTVGNIPLNWYDDYPHIGYDLDGTKIMKPAKGDEASSKVDIITEPEVCMGRNVFQIIF